jgi:uncharacterized protein (TIRG00374 family)
VKKKILTLAQLALGVGLITFLFYRMDNKADLLNALKAIASHPLYLAGALLCFFFCIAMCAWRWKLILAAHDMQLSFLKALELYFIGQFFNAFMLGAVGGDLIKVFVVAKTFPDKKTEAVTTVFIDRFVGLLALVMLMTIIVALRYPFFARYPETQAFAYFVGAILIAIIAGLIVVFQKNVFEHWAIFRRLEASTPLGQMLSRVYSAFHGCLNQRHVLLGTLTISMANHLAIIVAALLLGLGLDIRTVCPPHGPPTTVHSPPATMRSVGLGPLSTNPSPPILVLAEFSNYLTVFPIINGIAAIPATPGGLGTREYATEFLLGVPEFGVPSTRSIPLSLLLYATTLFWSLVGGIVYASYTLRSGNPTATELQDLS